MVSTGLASDLGIGFSVAIVDFAYLCGDELAGLFFEYFDLVGLSYCSRYSGG